MNLRERLLKYRLPKSDYDRLRKSLGREPEDRELALASALWNEHCSYRSSRAHLTKFQFSTKKNISSLGENAGVVDLGRGERVAFKMESHNHPSYITPYQGAATGVGGILRDVFAMGARPVLLADWLGFGSSDMSGSRERVDGVVRGIGGYGNCIGVPTLTGHTEFSKSYDKNILVNALALGVLSPGKAVMSSKAEGVGNYVVYGGARTGRDGILGASMASESFQGEAEDNKPAVQIGDPFYGKQLMEACLEIMERGLVSACQDMGAAGLTCSCFEMAEKGGVGVRLFLDRVPLRDSSLSPEDILLSESQERMLFVCEPSKWEDCKAVFQKHGLEMAVVGEILKEKDIEIYWKEKEFLKISPGKWESPLEDPPIRFPDPAPRAYPRPEKGGVSKDILLQILKSPQGRSREFIYRQYDQRVGTNTVKDSSFPLAVIRLPDTGRELALTLGGRPHLMEIDVREGAKDAVFYPALQLALRGFTPWAVTDCLNFGNPQKPEIMGEFVLSVESIASACKALDTPVVSGNVSFYNESQNRNITPTPVLGMIGLREPFSLDKCFTSQISPDEGGRCSIPPAESSTPHTPSVEGKKSVSPVKSSAPQSPSSEGEERPIPSVGGFFNERETFQRIPQSDRSPFVPSAGFLSEGERVYLLSAPQFSCSGLLSKILKRKAWVFGSLGDELSQLFIFRVLEFSQKVSFQSARVVGKFGLLYTLARMVLEKGVGFVSKKEIPFLFEERLYEVLVSLHPSEEANFKKQSKILGLESLFLGETKGTALQIGNMVCSFEEMERHYKTSWKDLSL